MNAYGQRAPAQGKGSIQFGDLIEAAGKSEKDSCLEGGSNLGLVTCERICQDPPRISARWGEPGRGGGGESFPGESGSCVLECQE